MISQGRERCAPVGVPPYYIESQPEDLLQRHGFFWHTCQPLARNLECAQASAKHAYQIVVTTDDRIL